MPTDTGECIQVGCKLAILTVRGSIPSPPTNKTLSILESVLFTPHVLRVYTKHMKYKNNSHPRKHELHPDTFLFSFLILFIFIVLSFILAYFPFVAQKGNHIGACTDETRVCPGGSRVSRSGPNCNFTRCPNNNLPNRPGITEEPFEVPVVSSRQEPIIVKENTAIACTDVVKLCPDGSFVGKVGKNCEFAPCPDDLESESDR